MLHINNMPYQSCTQQQHVSCERRFAFSDFRPRRQPSAKHYIYFAHPRAVRGAAASRDLQPLASPELADST